MDNIAYWFSAKLIWLLYKLGLYESIGSALEGRVARLWLGYFLMILGGTSLLEMYRKARSKNKAIKKIKR
jgi:hypothetical protein